ncbi:PQQ-binding-like beta-propeller repeat protein [Streptomyces sp. CA-249302]|uniref:outer membrane protein assembly factor BamB family protein n=1 Tax=Streptomyces sp. CA-249302 TaxID=3240058 RepID=UPI003D93F1FE
MADEDRVRLTVDADAQRRLWTLRAVGGGVGRPVVVGGAVYVPVPGGRIAALDAESGQLRWCSEEIEKAKSAESVVAGEVVVVPVGWDRERKGFTALDAATGKVRWTRRKSRLHRIAAVGDKTLVIWNDENEERGAAIAGVDALTGETLWEDEFKRIYGLVVRGERVILDDGNIRALDGRGGEELWEEGSGSLLEQDGSEDAAVFRSWSGGVRNTLAVRASETGRTLAETRFPDGKALKNSWHSPTLVDGNRALFAGPFERGVQLFSSAEPDRARFLGSWRLSRWRSGTLREAVCVGDRVYVVTWRRQLYAARIDDGRNLRRLSPTGPYGKVVRPHDLVAGPGYVLTWDRDTVALIRDGSALWTKAVASPILGGPVPLGHDRVLLQVRDRRTGETRLACVDAETGRHLG